MDPKQRWARLAAILEAALEAPAERRAALVREACAGDERLHAEITALLTAHAQSSGFLERSAVALVADTGSVTTPVAPSSSAPRFSAGHTLGRYRIERLLGAGGMGEVYAADDVEHGRRVAVKVLKQRLPSPEVRDRFLQEGRLASAVNHPNIVYVFGSEVIDGHPVIAMELLEGGTLKDRVQRDGPLPAVEAVEAILQVVRGLEAAHAGGIVHRDIKPGNCFVDRDGTVKVGDFGVSATTGAELTQRLPTTTIQVTPQYVAPEQLRGSAPDVRADVYAAGATLFYLLTGRPPFDDPDLLVLLSRLQTDPAPSPRSLVPGVPRGLAAVVARCLAKNPRARYPSFAELRAALSPFRSGSTRAAPVAARIAAAAVDQIVVLLLTSALNLLTLTLRGMVSPIPISSAVRYGAYLSAYFLVTEGIGSASIGKRAFGLRVVDLHGGRPGIGQVAARTAMFALVAALPFLPSLEFWLRLVAAPDLMLSPERASFFVTASWIVGVAGRLVPLVLFAAARPWNGWAGLHERLSGTRVTQRVADDRAGLVVQAVARATHQLTPSGRRGPFELRAPFPADATMWYAFDPVLERDVWIRDVSPDAALSPPARRALSRPGRLRWLAGHAGAPGWEAFEAPRGAPLSAMASRPRPWAIVRVWLADLASELAACDASGESMPFGLDRVWITSSGHATLLDFAAPGAEPLARSSDDAARPSPNPQRLLRDVAVLGLTGAEAFRRNERRLFAALPPAGTALMRALHTPGTVRAGDLRDLALQALDGATTVPRWSRFAPAAAVLVPLALIALMGSTFSRLAGQPLILGVGSDDAALFNALVTIERLERIGSTRTVPHRDALEVYVARRYEGLEKRAASFGGLLAPYRTLAESIARRRPPRSGDLESAVQTLGQDELRALNAPPRLAVPFALFLPLLALPAIAALGAVSIVLAFWARGGALLTLRRLVVVDASGERVTRARAAARALVAWAPVFALIPIAHHTVRALVARDVDGWVVAAGLLAALVGAAGVMSLMAPGRGIPERVTRTWIVPA
jgi:uncharacterized RDD family membrane protein YckC